MIYEITILFEGGGTLTVYATGYKYYYTGHHGNASGKVFEIADSWYMEGSPRIGSIEVDKICAVTKREMPGRWTYNGGPLKALG
jgi:hypothetical protein